MAKVALVVGAGAFGTSIASILAHQFDKVVLKVRAKDVYESIKSYENKVYLPGIKLPINLEAALTWEEVDEKLNGDPQVIVNGLPTAAITNYYSKEKERFDKYLKNDIPFISLSKGIDPQTLELSDDLFVKVFGAQFLENTVFLSGPSFAKEIVEKQVTIVSIAGKNPQVLLTVSKMLSTPYFKAFPTYDVKGVLLGGALKNILAIAGGILEGLGFNHNTRAAMITRGITEMLRFGKVFNARPETFYSFSGMGDLILTTTSSLSRNKSFGLKIAEGKEPRQIIDETRSVVEGYKTAKAAYLLSQKYQIRASLFCGVYDILYNNVKPQEVIERLMSTPIEVIE